MRPRTFLLIWILTITSQSFSYPTQVVGLNPCFDSLNPSFEFGFNTSYLTYNLRDLERRVTTEIRIGATLEKTISKSLAIKSGLRVGIKPKKPAYTIGFPLVGNDYLIVVDETLSMRNHFYLEVPVALVFNRGKFQIGSGMMLRHYINNGQSGDRDLLKGQYETGIYSLFGYHLGSGLRVGLECYFGITPIFNVGFGGTPFSPPISFLAKNNFVGLSIAYALNGQ